MANAEEMLEACETASNIPKHRGGPGYSDWEQEFLESIRDQFDEKNWLSDRQLEILTELYDKT